MQEGSSGILWQMSCVDSCIPRVLSPHKGPCCPRIPHDKKHNESHGVMSTTEGILSRCPSDNGLAVAGMELPDAARTTPLTILFTIIISSSSSPSLTGKMSLLLHSPHTSVVRLFPVNPVILFLGATFTKPPKTDYCVQLRGKEKRDLHQYINAYELYKHHSWLSVTDRCVHNRLS